MGPAPSSTSARRTCRCGQPVSVGSSAVGRRSPGSRSAQPPAWPGRRTATRRRARRRRGPRAAGRARVEHDQRARIAVGAQAALHELAAAGQARPVDPRRGRALAVGAQAVEVDLGGHRRAPAAAGQPVPSPRPVGHHRLQARQDQQLVGPGGGDDARARPSGSRTTTRGGARTLRPRRAKRDVDAHRASCAGPSPAARRPRAAVLDEPAGHRQRPFLTTTPIVTGCSSIAPGGHRSAHLHAAGAAATHSAAPAASTMKATPGT